MSSDTRKTPGKPKDAVDDGEAKADRLKITERHEGLLGYLDGADLPKRPETPEAPPPPPARERG